MLGESDLKLALQLPKQSHNRHIHTPSFLEKYRFAHLTDHYRAAEKQRKQTRANETFQICNSAFICKITG